MWCPERGSNPYAPIKEAADFKSDVSTNFTIRASGLTIDDNPNETSPGNAGWRGCFFDGGWIELIRRGGGATRSRTGLDGFAIRCITALLSRHAAEKRNRTREKKGSSASLFQKLEREKSLELSTSTLARLRSTN
jgi:hypothetical protein